MHVHFKAFELNSEYKYQHFKLAVHHQNKCTQTYIFTMAHLALLDRQGSWMIVRLWRTVRECLSLWNKKNIAD